MSCNFSLSLNSWSYLLFNSEKCWGILEMLLLIVSAAWQGIFQTWPAQCSSGRVSTLSRAGCGFDSQPAHTKDYKYGTHCLPALPQCSRQWWGLRSPSDSWVQRRCCPPLPQGWWLNAEDTLTSTSFFLFVCFFATSVVSQCCHFSSSILRQQKCLWSFPVIQVVVVWVRDFTWFWYLKSRAVAIHL